MSVICPTVTAYDLHEYRSQVDVVSKFAPRIHIDLMDGDFAPTVSPGIDSIWLPENIEVDMHIMYRNPAIHLEKIMSLKPSMVIVHAESNCDIPKFASDLREVNIKTGLAILQDTEIDTVNYLFPHIQHLLIFGGVLGKFGGSVDPKLFEKIKKAKSIHKYLEIGWDGGVNVNNCTDLVAVGVDVLNVGGAIQKAEIPQEAYATMVSKIDTHD